MELAGENCFPITSCTSSGMKHSERMRRVHRENTNIEIAVRKMLYRMGYRYRCHVKDLPGKPDIVFRKRKRVIFVHGCFWHQHEGCKAAQLPKTRAEYWQSKFERNVARDKENQERLMAMGWEVFVVWGCELKAPEAVEGKLKVFLSF